MKVGDLVCYNGAGMRKKTLGVIYSEWFDCNDNRYLKIRWAIRGEYMPRWSYEYYTKHNQGNPWSWKNGPEGGNKEYLWYDDAHYFEKA